MGKTIVTTFDEISRMMDFCHDSKGDISRSFYDWYLKEVPAYFADNGMLIVDGLVGKKEKVSILFDLTMPDQGEFRIYRYNTQQLITTFRFNRYDNMSMKDVSIKTMFFSMKSFAGQDAFWTSPDYVDKLKVMAKHDAFKQVRRKQRTGGKISAKGLVKKSMANINRDINGFHCRFLTQAIYALMYYVSMKEPEEITSLFKKEVLPELGKKKGTYKYTGYVDLTKSRVYRPVIKKDRDEPIREYNRHIQKWSVRGHYRRTKAGLIWIAPHHKGEGEMEKRIYGTKPESEVNLIPKLFDVDIPIREEEAVKIVAPSRIKRTITPKPKKRRLIAKILGFFGFRMGAS